MPRGQSDIPELRLEVLQGYFERFVTPPELILSNIFGSSVSPSSSVLWESYRGGRGLTPFVPRGSPAPQHAPLGVSQHRAEAAYWKEKMPFDEEFLNNLRKPGTTAEHMDAEYKLSRELANLKNRSDRRKEWMFAQMLFNNGFTYDMTTGYKATVGYGIPALNQVTLGALAAWGLAGANPILDIQTGKRVIKNECGGRVDIALFNSSVLTLLANTANITNLLRKDAFGNGNLYGNLATNVHDIVGVNPQVIGSLLDIPRFVCYDEVYEVKAWLTMAITGGATTWFTVDDCSDMYAGDWIRFNDASLGTWEQVQILSVDYENRIIRTAGAPANSYIPIEDFVTVRRPFIPDNTFVMMSTRVNGQAIAEYKEAPYGVARHYGQFVDQNEDWDPEVVWIRVQDCGIPILYNVDAVYIITVVPPWIDTATSTTTTSTSSSSTCSTLSSTCTTTTTTTSPP